MSEIYRNTVQFVTLDIVGATADGTPTATCTHPDHPAELTVESPEIVNGVQRWTAALGLAHTQDVGRLSVVWDFSIGDNTATKVDNLSIVVPLVEISDVRNELSLPVDVTDQDIVLVERRVRRTIERICGQRFAPVKDVITLRGSGDTFIRLPKRLISIESVADVRTGISYPWFAVGADGWTLEKNMQYSLGDWPKADVDGVDGLTVTGPIFNPYDSISSYIWRKGLSWTVTGVWGWEYVPEAVAEAALILIESELCPDATYRNRYLTSMRAADWRFDISRAAFAGTGNVIADQLLADYRVVKAAVI